LKKIIKKTVRDENDEYIEKLTNRVWDKMQVEDAGISLPRKEGMQGFYDKMIPDFVNKYTKKWGGKVTQSKLPSGETVWSLDLTPAMKTEIMTKGQPIGSSTLGILGGGVAGSGAALTGVGLYQKRQSEKKNTLGSIGQSNNKRGK